MKLKKRKIVALMLAVMMLTASSAFADVREPESRSYNGYMDDGTCIYDKGTSDSSDFGITPRVGYVQCGATIISTGGDHGSFRYYNLGTATFPSDEVHMDVAESV